MRRDRTYDPNDGEFVDFETLDYWRARDEKKDAEIKRLRKSLSDAEDAVSAIVGGDPRYGLMSLLAGLRAANALSRKEELDAS